MPKISVIIPAYNAEKYVRASVESVLGQTHRDVEVIVANDGSGDGTRAILEEMAAVDSRLKVLNLENGGPARARNIALQNISDDSEYVAYLDADDLYDPDAFEYALKGADGADIVVMGFTIRRADGSGRQYCEPECMMDRDSFCREFPRLYRANVLNQAWGKLFRRELLTGGDGVVFPDYRWGEDRLFVFEALKKARSVKILPECKHNYIMHEGESLISRFLDAKPDICVEIDRGAEALAAGCSAEDEAWMRCMFAKSIFSCLTNLYSPSCRLDRSGRRAYAEKIVRNEYVRERVKGAAGGAAVKVLAGAVRTGMPGLNLAVFAAVARASKLAPKLVTSLKHRK